MTDRSVDLYNSDKDIFDLLISSQKRFTVNSARAMARSRNLFVSQRLDREDAADYLSRLPFSHRQIQGLLEDVVVDTRRAVFSYSNLDTKADVAEIRSIINEIISEKSGFNTGDVKYTNSKTTAFSLDYVEHDYSRNKLSQRVDRTADFHLEKSDQSIQIKGAASEFSEMIFSEIKKKLETLKKETIADISASLSHLTSAEARTEFFIAMLRHMPEYEYKTARTVRVGRFTEESITDGDDADDVTDRVAEELKPLIDRVIIHGQQVLGTAEFVQLQKGGFFITALTWDCLERSEPRNLVRFSISFDDPIGGTGVRYNVSVAELNTETELYRGFRRPKVMLERQLLDRLDSAARELSSAVRAVK